ncbi:hypothetical protein ILUMI_20361 [Ignelater luminosus]|uniref:Uncharacterized protein n=1 Tax=Ignelater luminosus TaxID=2038154 RepID=A0A8K0CEF1_IGNLU|nr:hypothetical protein ILUMI_20361 [Ignelater luminosus]
MATTRFLDIFCQLGQWIRDDLNQITRKELLDLETRYCHDSFSNVEDEIHLLKGPRKPKWKDLNQLIFLSDEAKYQNGTLYGLFPVEFQQHKHHYNIEARSIFSRPADGKIAYRVVLHCTHTAVQKCMQRFRETGRNTRRTEFGKKEKPTAADDRFITLRMLRNRTSICVEARNQHRGVHGVDANPKPPLPSIGRESTRRGKEKEKRQECLEPRQRPPKAPPLQLGTLGVQLR